MIRLWIIVSFFICAPLFVSAQATEDFTIKVFGALDTIAPSTPTIQSIVPIGPTQIDLRWSTSTDNYNVFGYIVSRDGSVIATTTSTSYSDTGLSASTTYSYTVQAFDGVPNYSSTSVPAATSTPGIPVVVVPESESISGTVARTVLSTFSVVPAVTSASLLIETRRPARIEVRVGKTSSYEIGYFVGNRFSIDHTVPINDLEPNTTYYYEVLGYTPFGIETLLRRGSFMTLSEAATRAPENVQAFSAFADGSDVQLSWEIPNTIPPDSRIRIVRSHYGYPSFINDGVVIYEGRDTRTTDVAVLNQYGRVFYTAFVIDPNGLISSGAIAQIFVRPNPVSDVSLPDQPTFTESGTSTVEVEVPEIQPTDMPDPSWIEIQQLETVYTFASSSIPLSSSESFSISIPADQIVGDFKTIVATLEDPRGSKKVFSFLLRLNADKTLYQAVIAPVVAPGNSDLMVEIYDYDALVVARYMTNIIFSSSENTASSTLEVLWLRLVSLLWFALLLVPVAVLGFVWFVFKRRSAEDEDNNT